MVYILSLRNIGVLTNIIEIDWKMKKIETERKRKAFSVLIEIVVVISLIANIFSFDPFVMIGLADTGDIPDVWDNSTTLNITTLHVIPRILWYDNQSGTWVSRPNTQNDGNDNTIFRFIIVNLNNDERPDIQFVNITAWDDQGTDGNIPTQTSAENGNLFPQYFWDTTTDHKTKVNHSIGTLLNTINDNYTKTITMTISVEKANWTYIEVTDLNPNNPDLIVKTAEGRTILSDMIWREDGKIFILDDSVTEYQIIYSYLEGPLFDITLDLTPESVSSGADISALIPLINVGEPGLVNGTVNYTLYKGEEIIWSSEEDVSVLSQKAYTKTISTSGLSPGSYTYKVIYSYAGGQTASAQRMFSITAPTSKEFPFLISFVLILLILGIILVVLWGKNVLSIEGSGDAEDDRKEE
jgi:hypothetical protein